MTKKILKEESKDELIDTGPITPSLYNAYRRGMFSKDPEENRAIYLKWRKAGYKNNTIMDNIFIKE